MQLFKMVKMSEIIMDRRQLENITFDCDNTDFISFQCSLETETRLGAMGDRDDLLQENEKRT